MKKTIKIDKNDLRKIIKESLNIILQETHMHSLYHFVTPHQFQFILENGFTLNGEEASYSINKSLPNFLSFSRNRNGVQGFPYMVSKYGGSSTNNEGDENIIVRIEIDGDKLNKYGKIKPFDYNYHFQGISSKTDIADLANYFKNSPNNEGIYNQPLSQSEDRLFSELENIPKQDSLKMIKCVDVFIDRHNISDEEINNIIKWFKKITNNYFKIKFYFDINKFNLKY